MRIAMVLSLVLLIGSLSSCGKVREASQMVNAVKEVAEVAQDVSEGMDSGEIDLENLNISEDDIRTYYTGITQLNEAYPDIDFEIALTAALDAASQGKNLEKIVEKETDMSFEEYNTLSMAITMIQIEAAGVLLAQEMVVAMEQGIAQFDDMDMSDFTEEQMAEIEEQRKALVEAKKEMESPENKKLIERVDMVTGIRKELGY